MVDQFGNYLSQKVMEVCSESQLAEIVEKVLPQITKISMNVHGTRSVQTLIDFLSKKTGVFEKDLFRIIDQLKSSVKELSLVSLRICLVKTNLERAWEPRDSGLFMHFQVLLNAG